MKFLTEEECKYLEKALEEYEKNGKTQKKCLRCGSDLVFEVTKSSYSIRCFKNCGLTLVGRGI